MWSYFAKGGPVMWPLLVLSILAVVVIVWRWLALREATRNAASLQDASAHELMALERGLPVLATVAMIAPLLGFLGTVTGMINSFDALAAVGLNNPAAVASGISEALITTAAGLMIAIPVQMAYNYFVVRVNVTVRDMEAAANLVLEALTDVRLSETGGERAAAPRLAVPNPNPAAAR